MDSKIEEVSLEGDQIEFSVEENKVKALGNVRVSKGDVVLTSDYLEYSRESQVADLQGNVVMLRGRERFEGERLTFNFTTMKGDFLEAKIAAKPFFGSGERISRIDENHLRMEKGRLTTCDLDRPHFCFYSKQIDVFPQEKATAKHVRMLVGGVPILYIPRFTQNLTDKKPVVTVIPGYDKDWGTFFLTQWRYYLTERVKGVVHLDWRERKDLASGFDVNYSTPRTGEGLIRTYYTNERNITSKHFWQERPSPTVERERFKIEWRHKWQIDEQTSAISQYYKLSDADFLKDYFEREYDNESNPQTYFLFTRNLGLGTTSFRTDARVNRFVGAVERLPEVSYDLPGTKVGHTGMYWNSKTMYSNLVKKSASPSEIRQKTMRVHTDNQMSYPLKVAFIELKPYVGGQETFYTRLKDDADDNSIRGVFRTGADLSTKFYRIFETEVHKWGLEINRLRHIVTPSVAYQYQYDPTILNDKIEQFDSIDDITRKHRLTFSLENKLQTKRKEQSVDLARMILSSDFLLKEDPGKGGFNTITSDIEIQPYQWLRFDMDASYDTLRPRLQSLNFDLNFNNYGQDWFFKLGKRYNVNVDDLITTEWGYKINPKWYFSVFQQYNIDQGFLKEQEYQLKRDLHCWEMILAYNQTRGEGTEIWVVFKMKAFPEMGFDINTRFNRRKTGSQVE